MNLASLALAVCLAGCTESIDPSARYVAESVTVCGYLRSHPEYSEYVGILGQVAAGERSSTMLDRLLDARGHYTVFAPTDAAIHAYLDELSAEGLAAEPDWAAFYDERKRDSVLKVIAYNSIIDSGDQEESFETAGFPLVDGSEFALPTLNGRKLSVHYVEGYPDSIYIDKVCPVNRLNRDMQASNGIIHQMDRVIAPRNITAADYVERMLDGSSHGLLAFARMVQACGLLDTLRRERDERYEALYRSGKIPDLANMTGLGFTQGTTAYAPEHRLYGFTLFAETDEFWQGVGISPDAPDFLPSVVQWIADNDLAPGSHAGDDYDSPDNSLCQWVTYHILPMRLMPDKLVVHHNEYGFSITSPTRLGIPVWEYYTTFGKPRLLKVYESMDSEGIRLNAFPVLDNARKGSFQEVACDHALRGSRVCLDHELTETADMSNACLYVIDLPLSYTYDTRSRLQRERLRFDGMSLFPEAMNNDIRKKQSTSDRNQFVYMTDQYRYFENITQNEGTNMVYFNAYRYDWFNLNADEIKAVGHYDVTLRLPPVPQDGMYEIRYSVLAQESRGIVQVYLGTDPDRLAVTGIPMDLTMPASDLRTGWEADTEDDTYNAEIDKRMRNNGFMKGCQSVCEMGNPAKTARLDDRQTRRILCRQHMQAGQTYYLRMKSVLDSDRKEFYLDYLELCSKEVYDNPATPEDVW